MANKNCETYKQAVRGLVNSVIDMGSLSVAYKDTLDYTIVNEMIHDDDISIFMNSVIRDCKTRKWTIDTIKGEDPLQEQLQMKLNHVENFEQWVEETCNAFEYGYVAHEIQFDNKWNICRLNRIPYDSYDYDWTKQAWCFNSGKTFEELSDAGEAYILVSVYNQTYDYQKGQSILVDIYQDWCFLKSIDAKLRSIVEKYGNIITFFGYDATWSLDDEGKANIAMQAEMMAEMAGQDVIGVPITDLTPKLADNLYHITLDQLKTEIHNELMNRISRKIALYYMGATGHMEAGSNRAESEVHQQEKEKVVNERVDFVTAQYNKILAIDSFNFGYMATDYLLRGEKERDLTAEAELDIKQNESRLKVTESSINLQQSGLNYTKQKMAELLGVAVEDLEEVEIPDNTNKEIAEFAEDDVAGKIEATKQLSVALSEKSSIKESEVIEDLSKQIQLQLEELKSAGGLLKDEPYFNINISKQIDANEVASLLGYYDATWLHEITEEYLELNPFELPYQEAVNAYAEVEPLMIEKFDEHLAKNIDDYNLYVKGNTDTTVSNLISRDLERNIKQGLTFKEWKSDVGRILQKTGTSADGSYLKNVYRTNIQSAYNSAQQQEQRDTKDFFPYLEYIGIDDVRQSDICETLDGTVRKANDPFWNTYYPPNHYQCRSRVTSMTEEQFKERYGKITRINKSIKELELGDFDNSPLTTDYKSKLKKKNKSWEQQKINLDNAMKED